jgi:3-deoxy-D-manno-octulosonate 8-phosphate phosphatase (KDO 8-P phosphatase)
MGPTAAVKAAPADRDLHPADIKLLVLDVDGVLTDGGIYLAADGQETKRFDVQDGAGVKYWQRAGRMVAILSGRSAAATLFRAAELGVEHVRQNAKQKLPVYLELLAALGVSPAETAVMGDDLPDLPLMRHCGFAIAPANAAEEVRAAARLVTLRAGGHGAVREAIEHLLKAAGLWENILQRYREDG